MRSSIEIPSFQIRPATKADVPVIFSFIKKLADYERLSHEVTATEKTLGETLFGRRRTAEVAIGYFKKQPRCFATSPHWRESGSAADWNGRCWIGTNRRFTFIKSSAPRRCASGRSSD